MKEIKKSDIENLSYKDIANLILTKENQGINTLDLFTKIINLLELPHDTIENKIAEFYTSLATDKRFILLDGVWDLRNRHTSDKIIMDAIEEDDTDMEEIHDENESIEDEYGDEFREDSVVSDEFNDTEEDDLTDLVILDEEDLTE